MASSNQNKRLARAVWSAFGFAAFFAVLATAYVTISRVLITPQTDDLGITLILANVLSAVIAVVAGAWTAVAAHGFAGGRDRVKVAGPNLAVLVFFWLAGGQQEVIGAGVVIFFVTGYLVVYAAARVLGCEGDGSSSDGPATGHQEPLR